MTDLSPLSLRIVLENDLCCGCGTCVGVCPAGALHISYGSSPFPHIDEDRCTDCGLCSRSCPGLGIALREHVTDPGSAFHPLLGHYEQIYQGYSLDPTIREHATSGGIATTILCHLLQQQYVEKVSIVIWEDTRPVVKLTSDLQEIMVAMKSKYTYIPLNILIPEILSTPGKVAITGTPCQIEGLTLAQKHIPALKEKVFLKIGLFCGFVQDYDSISAIKTHCYGSNDCVFTGWREKPYPGYLVCKGQEKTGRLHLYRGLDVVVPFYSLNRCFLCEDGTNELADIVLGDVHSRGSDENIVVVRTTKASRIMKQMQERQLLHLDTKGKDEIEHGQLYQIIKNKRLKSAFLNQHLRSRGVQAPDFSIRPDRNTPLSLTSIFQYYGMRFLKKHRAFFEKHPSLQEFVGHFFFTFPDSLPGFTLFWSLTRHGKKQADY